MEKVVRKWFTIGDFDEEEIWLNDMVAQGWALQEVKGMTYRFESCQPDAYIYRLDYLADKSTEEVADYKAFLAESGAEYVTAINDWAYFRQKRELGDFVIYSDRESKLAYLYSIRKRIVLAILLFLCLFPVFILPTLSLGFDLVKIIIVAMASLAILLLIWLFRLFLKMNKKAEKLLEEADLFE